MATIQQIIDRAQQKMYIAAGANVQIHAEDGMTEFLRSAYNTLFDSRWWQDYMVTETFELDGITGTVVGDLTDKIRKFTDIYAVFYDREEHALPVINSVHNPSNVRRRGIKVNPSPSSVFTVCPVDSTGPVHVTYRTRVPDTVWEEYDFDHEINMDDELLINLLCYDFMVDDGSNPEATQRFLQRFESRMRSITNNEMSQGISKSSQSSNVLTDWEPHA